MKNYLLRPYHRQSATEHQEQSNYKLSSVRRVIECTFGITVAKWRVLKTEIQCKHDKVDLLVKCVCLLHNIVIGKEGSAEVEPSVQVKPGRLASLVLSMLKLYILTFKIQFICNVVPKLHDMVPITMEF